MNNQCRDGWRMYVFASAIVAAWALEASADHLPNPWARTIGEAIGLRDVTKDMRNRSARLFHGSPIEYLATAQNEIACSLLKTIECGAPSYRVQKEIAMFQQVQRQLNEAISCDREASRDHGLRTYRRLVEDRLLDLIRDLERCTQGTNSNFESGIGFSGGAVRRHFRSGVPLQLPYAQPQHQRTLRVPLSIQPFPLSSNDSCDRSRNESYFGYSTYMFEDYMADDAVPGSGVPFGHSQGIGGAVEF